MDGFIAILTGAMAKRNDVGAHMICLTDSQTSSCLRSSRPRVGDGRLRATTSGDEPRDTGLDHDVEANVGRKLVSNLLHRI
jgi:hypothetical protein